MSKIPPPMKDKRWKKVGVAKLHDSKKHIDIELDMKQLFRMMDNTNPVIFNRKMISAVLAERYDEVYLYKKS